MPACSTPATLVCRWAADDNRSGANTALSSSEGRLVELGWGPEEEAFRAELIEFLEREAPTEAVGRDFATAGEDEGIPEWARAWQAKLFDSGWLVPGYPRHLGGRDATPSQSLIYAEELASRGLPRSLHFPGYAIVAPSLLDFGNQEQRQLAPLALRGDTIWCIGMSEPEAGSDLASLSTRAERDGDRFVVNGQKVWTSYATWAEKCFCYVRTDADAPKHKGISVLIIDMNSKGVEVRPLKHITGKANFAEVFFTDVEVPAANLVGSLNDGWRITMGSLAHERGGLWVQGVAGLEHVIGVLTEQAHQLGIESDVGVRRSLSHAYAQVASLRALGYKGFSTFAKTSSSPEHSFLKLASSEMSKSLAELGVQLEGGLGTTLDDSYIDHAGRWANTLLANFAATIAGGTSEIQRNIIAERVLGLPRQ